MSSQRGNVERTRPTKYKNTFKFVHNKGSRKTKQILESPIEGVCEKCYKILAWKKEYRKYKPLTVPKRCTMCQEKKITRSYTNVCDGCATKNGICAKCREKKAYVQDFDAAKKEKQEQLEKERILAQLTERERRRYLMHLERGDFEESDEDEDEKGEAKEGDEHDSENDSDDEKGSAEHEKEVGKKEPSSAAEKKASSTGTEKPTALLQAKPAPPASKNHDNDVDDTSDAEDEEDDDEVDGDLEDVDEDDLDEDDDDSDEDEDDEDRPQIADPSNPIPGRKIFRGRRTMPEAATSSPSPSKPETLDSSDDELHEINKSFDKDEEDEDDPFLAALKAAEEKKKVLASPPKAPVVDLASKYNPKPSELFQNRSAEVDVLESGVKKLSLGDKEADLVEEDEDSDDGPVKPFVFKAFQ